MATFLFFSTLFIGEYSILQIDLLEDILVHMQRSSTYERLQTQLQSLVCKLTMLFFFKRKQTYFSCGVHGSLYKIKAVIVFYFFSC